MSTQPIEAPVRSTAAESAPALLSVRNVAKRFGSTPVLTGICLDVAPGEFLTILGETGSGKTTLLRLVAGFERPDEGEIWMGGERLDTLPPYRRRVNTVFQSYALFPHLTVSENVAYGLKARKTPRNEIQPRVDEALTKVKMSAFAQRLPSQLSGGQQQRVALARALVNRPQLLLLDEPLSALDAGLRQQLQTELKLLQRDVGITFVFVTHDQDEALALSDRIALLRAGNIEQLATPREIYLRPCSLYTARFIGKTNLLKASVDRGLARCGTLCWPAAGPDGDATFSLRPESIRLMGRIQNSAAVAAEDGRSGNASSPARFRATVRNQSFGGASDLIEVEDSGGLRLLVRIPCARPLAGEWRFEFSANDAVRLRDEARG
ncbi:MAG: ABC transporter ATP-binding protein [Terriglobia bacterium]